MARVFRTADVLRSVKLLELVFSPGAGTQSTLSPDAALTELMDGNKRFTTAAH